MITQPLLSITFSADVTILPFVGRGLVENAASADKTYVEIAGDHFGFRDTADGPGGREGGIVDVARAIIAWLAPRFAAAVARP